VIEAGQVRHPRAAVSALAAEADARAALLPLLRAQGLAPASVAELAAATGVDPGLARKVLGALAADGAIVRVSSELHFSAEAIAGARDALEAHLRGNPSGATAAELRDALGVSRKYAIPLLEYFDAQGVTRREGDLRVLRKG
jgi:selenocysteine-specific elongation factor